MLKYPAAGCRYTGCRPRFWQLRKQKRVLHSEDAVVVKKIAWLVAIKTSLSNVKAAAVAGCAVIVFAPMLAEASIYDFGTIYDDEGATAASFAESLFWQLVLRPSRAGDFIRQ